MGLKGTNVDTLRRQIYNNGFVRHNRYEISYFPNVGNVPSKTGVAAFAVKIPGWDTTTTTETNVFSTSIQNEDWGSPKIMPIRKHWNQSLFVTFYMDNGIGVFEDMELWHDAVVQGGGPLPFYNENIFNSKMSVLLGENSNRKQWDFYECWPRVLYPIDLKPVEDFSPVIFSIQFVYRYSEYNSIVTSEGN